MSLKLKITVVFLAVCTLVGCFGTKSDNKNTVSAEMTEQELYVANELAVLYGDFGSENILKYVFDTTNETAELIENEFSNVIGSTSFKEILVKEIGEHEGKILYAVSAKYQSDDKVFAVNDCLLTDIYNDDIYILLQQFYNSEIQIDIADAFDGYHAILDSTYKALNKKLGVNNTVSTLLGLSVEERNLENQNGKLYGNCGVLTSDSMSIAEILVLNNMNSYGSGRGGSSFADDNKQNNKEENEVPQTHSDGRKLVWNIEFTEDELGQVSSKLNTKQDSMIADNRVLFVSEGEKNFFFESGDLVLRITQNSDGSYTTSRTVSTKDRMSYKYGYVEMRAKVPYKSTVWPSFWMQSDSKLQKSKYFGEIDIFEVFGSSNTAVFNLHKWYNNTSVQSSNKGNFTGSRYYKFTNSTNLSDKYHVYGFEWTKDYMKAYIDGTCYYTISIKEEDDYAPERPGMDVFHDYYYLIWNNWLETSKITASNYPSLPADYRIDYVRLYQYTDSEYIKIY